MSKQQQLMKKASQTFLSVAKYFNTGRNACDTLIAIVLVAGMALSAQAQTTVVTLNRNGGTGGTASVALEVSRRMAV